MVESAGSFTKLEDALFKTLSDLTKDRRVLLIGAQVPAGCEINRPRLLQGPLHHAAPRPCPSISRDKIESVGAAVNDVLSRVRARLVNRVELIRPIDLFMRHKLPRFLRRALALLGFDPLHSGRLIPHDRHGERTRAGFSSAVDQYRGKLERRRSHAVRATWRSEAAKNLDSSPGRCRNGAG